MTLWTNNGRPNTPDLWADIVRNARLRVAAKAVAIAKRGTQYVDIDMEGRWAA